MAEIRTKKHISGYKDYDTVTESFWMKDAACMHTHTTDTSDPLWIMPTPDSKFCTSGDAVVFTSGNNLYGKIGWISEEKQNATQRKQTGTSEIYGSLTGTYPHLCSDNKGRIFLTKYGNKSVETLHHIHGIDNPVYYSGYYEDDLKFTKKQISTSDSKMIGCVYVPNGDNGMWIAISCTNLYYATADNIIEQKYDSIVYHSDNKEINKYVRLRDNDFKACEYGDYVYAVGCGTGGEYLYIKISKQSNAIVDYKAMMIGDFQGCREIIIQKNKNGMGTSPVLLCGGAGKKLKIITFDAPDQLNTIKIYETGLKSQVEPQIAGFNSGLGFIAFMYNGDGSSQGYTYNVEFADKKIDMICTSIQQFDGSNPTFNSYYDGDYCAIQVISQNIVDKIYPTNYFSSRDGVHWHGNLGYVYTVDADGDRTDVTRCFGEYVTDKKTGVTGKFVCGSINTTYEDGYYIYRFKIPDNIDPTLIIMGSTERIQDGEVKGADP